MIHCVRNFGLLSIMSDIHLRGSFQWLLTAIGYACDNTGRAPPAAGTSRIHGKFVETDAKLLAPWSPLAPDSFRSLTNSSYTVSPLFILATHGLTVSSV